MPSCVYADSLRLTRLLRWMALAATAVALGAVSIAGGAATINVANNFDYAFGSPPTDGDGHGCTFRKALKNALNGNQTFTDCTSGSAGADVIHFADTADFTLGTLGVFDFITKDITVTAPGAKKFIGHSTGLGAGEIFHITGTAGKLTMNGFTLESAGNSAVFLANGGSLSMNVGAFNNNTHGGTGGGAITGDGTVALTAIHFNGNTAPNGSGGAINLNNAAYGAASITDSFFDNNTAQHSGGAIYYSGNSTVAPAATLTITNTQFGFVQANVAHAAGGATEGGGAIFIGSSGLTAQVSIVNSSFLNNKVDGTDGRGGAIFNHVADTLPTIVDHGLFTLNQVDGGANGMGGALYTEDSLVLRASSFIANNANAGKGGAIASNTRDADPSAIPPRLGAVVANSTIQGNSADVGAGLYSWGQFSSRSIQLVNVTMDGNTASTDAGGIRTESIGSGTGATRLVNTIVSNNTGGASSNCSGNAITGNNNLQFPGSSCGSAPVFVTGDPKLNAPFINPPDVLTLTMSLQPGSAASGAGDSSACAAFPVLNLDQRSLVVPIRPAGGANCDIGAYESSMAPDLAIAKTHVGSFTQGQAGAQYTITVSNGGNDFTSGTVSVVDTLPAGLTATAMTGSGWTCVLGTLTCTRSDVLAAGGSYPAITLTVSVAGNAPLLVINTATVSGGGDNTAGNNTANDPTTITVPPPPDLTIVKTHVGNFAQGQVGATYTITVSNAGGGPTDGSGVTVTDTLPAGLTATAMTGTGWTCVLGTLTCTRSDVLAAGGSYPAITLTVNVAANAPALVTNTVTVSGGGDTNAANNTATNPTTITATLLPDLTIAKTHVGNFAQGQVGATYTITVSNAGGGPTDGSVVTVTDTLPAGLTATAMTGTGWTCVLGTLTCTRSDVLAAGGSYPAITLTVNVAANAPALVTNTATVSGGGDNTAGNNTANDPTTITVPPPPDLTIAKTHVGNFAQGQVGATYTITVSNAGGGPTDGSVVTVTDTLPAGLTATAMTGSGWTCVLGTLTCTRSDVLAAGGSYPAITLTVNVAANAPALVTNTVTVSGGGDTNAANNTGSDVVTLQGAPGAQIAIPTLSETMLALLALLLFAAGALIARRR
ncbi:MAG: DUF11 domain-containing protein [Burkholderiales bacterium]